MAAVPLRRNRDFILLQIGQLLSNVGTQATSIAYPLLVLAVDHSAARAGIVSFARALPAALFALPAGVAAELCAVYNVEFALGSIYPGAAATVFGEATADGRYAVRWGDETLVDCPVEAITFTSLRTRWRTS